jgi:hypothetical protein
MYLTQLPLSPRIAEYLKIYILKTKKQEIFYGDLSLATFTPCGFALLRRL